MAALFAEVPGAIEQHAADRRALQCGSGFQRLSPARTLKSRRVTPPKATCAAVRERVYCAAMDARANDPVVRERLDYELGIIHTMGFDTYFLIVWDLCRYAAKPGHLVQRPRFGGRLDRGLSLWISPLVDPLEHGLDL